MLQGSSRLRRLVLSLLTIAPALAWAAPPRATVWVAEATEKIAADERARPDRVNARIAAARNEFEAFQIVVTGNARGVRATATPLSQPGVAPITNVRLHQAALMTISQPSAADSVTGRIPDALIPEVDEVVGEQRNAFPFDVGNESRAIWVEVFVPKTAAPGVYTGSVTVSHSRGQVAVPVELTVWGFELPSTSTVRSAFGLSWGALPSGHGFSESDFHTYATLRARYGQFALDHRVTLSGHDDGAWDDFNHFQRYYGPLMNGTPLTDGTLPPRLEGAKLTAVQYLPSYAALANKDVLIAEMKVWAERYRANGWFDRLFQYTCDEPPYQGCDWSDIALRASAAKIADPQFRTLVTTTINDYFPYVTQGVDLDLIVPVVNFMENRAGQLYAGNQRDNYDNYQGYAFLGSDPLNELWMYQSCMSHGCGGGGSINDTGWPSYMIDATAVRNRAMQWILFNYRATGELYWDTAYAYGRGDPWNSQWEFGGNGDGTLFYPGTPSKIGGTTNIPVASIRLKMIREGMEDYEYLTQAAKVHPLCTNAIAWGLFPRTYQTDKATPAALMTAREQLARLILAGKNGVVPTCPVPITP